MKKRDGKDDDSMGDDDDHEGAQVTKPGVNFRSNKLFLEKSIICLKFILQNLCARFFYEHNFVL